MFITHLACLFIFIGMAINNVHAHDSGISVASSRPEELPALGLTYYREIYATPSEARCAAICDWLHVQQQSGLVTTINQEVIPFVLVAMHKAGFHINDQDCKPFNQLTIATHFSDFLKNKFLTKEAPRRPVHSSSENTFIDLLGRLMGDTPADHSHDEIAFYDITREYKSGTFEQTLGAKAQTVRYIYGLCEMKKNLEEDHGTVFSPKLLAALSEDIYSIVLYKKKSPECLNEYTLQGWQSLVSQWQRYIYDSNHSTRLSPSTKSDISLENPGIDQSASQSDSSFEGYPPFATISQELIASVHSDNTSEDVDSDEDVYGPW